VAFRGWSIEALEFYEGLEADNSKSYWTAHKGVYQEHVYDPMTALLAELEPEFGKGKIFRPYRDVRYSADKSPYKTSIAATVEAGGYIHLSAEGLAAGNGMYTMATDQLVRYRRAVAADVAGEQLLGVIADVTGQRIVVSGHDKLKTAPKGYPKDHPRIDLLRNKGVVAWKEWPVAAWLGTAAGRTRVVDFLRASQPLNEWLDKHVGPTTLPTR
jgi:uncharacterized protein (TIGR02453 family)